MQRVVTSGRPEFLPQAQTAAAALIALARAARSLVLYDAGNATVRHHLSEYHAKMSRALEAYGDLTVTVAPFQLAVGGHIVLEERDREKSFPLKLYRDGVRVLRIQGNAPWEELLRLLQIVAIRYAAIRQQEEDTVTLLRRADLRFIQLESVEGLTEVEESPEPELKVRVDRAPRAKPPDGWDTPLQKLPPPGPIEYRPVAPEALADLRGEGDERATAALATGLAEDLLAEAARAEWPMPNRDLMAFFSELRDALLVDGELAPLRELVDVLGRAGASDLRDQMVRALGDMRTLELVLEAVPDDSDKLPPELVPFLPLLGVAAAVDALALPQSPARTQLLVKVILARIPREVDTVISRMPALPPPLVRELAVGILARAPERSAELARHLVTHRSEAMRLEGLEVIARAPVQIPVRPLCELLRDASEAVRLRAAEVLGTRGDESAVEPLCAVLADARPLSPDLAAAVGRSLAALVPARAPELFGGWIEEARSRFLARPGQQQRAQQWAAIAGLGLLPGPGAEQALRSVADRSDGELRRHCLAALARRRMGESRG